MKTPEKTRRTRKTEPLVMLTEKDFMRSGNRTSPEMRLIRAVPMSLRADRTSAGRRRLISAVATPRRAGLSLPPPASTAKSVTREDVRRLLPNAIAKKLSASVPEGFELTEITITGEISGMPFGIGVGGQVAATFTKKATRRRRK